PMETAQLSAIRDANITVNVTADLSNVADITGSGVIVGNGVTVILPLVTSYAYSSNRTLLANGANSVLDLANVSAITGSADFVLNVNGQGGGKVNLRRTAIINGVVQVTAQGADSEVDLSALTSFVTPATSTSLLRTSTGGRIRMAGLTNLDRVNLSVGGP